MWVEEGRDVKTGKQGRAENDQYFPLPSHRTASGKRRQKKLDKCLYVEEKSRIYFLPVLCSKRNI